MHLKQLALALLCSGALVAPVLAQTNAPPKTPAPVITSPSTPTATGTGTTSTSVPTTTTTTGQATSTTTTIPAPMKAPAPAPAPVAAAPQTSLTNINTASATDLDKLPQIGKARAAAIIKNRPYKATDDLLTKKVLSKGVFDKIKDKITA